MGIVHKASSMISEGYNAASNFMTADPIPGRLESPVHTIARQVPGALDTVKEYAHDTMDFLHEHREFTKWATFGVAALATWSIGGAIMNNYMQSHNMDSTFSKVVSLALLAGATVLIANEASLYMSQDSRAEGPGQTLSRWFHDAVDPAPKIPAPAAAPNADTPTGPTTTYQQNRQPSASQPA